MNLERRDYKDLRTGEENTIYVLAGRHTSVHLDPEELEELYKVLQKELNDDNN